MSKRTATQLSQAVDKKQRSGSAEDPGEQKNSKPLLHILSSSATKSERNNQQNTWLHSWKNSRANRFLSSKYPNEVSKARKTNGLHVAIVLSAYPHWVEWAATGLAENVYGQLYGRSTWIRWTNKNPTLAEMSRQLWNEFREDRVGRGMERFLYTEDAANLALTRRRNMD